MNKSSLLIITLGFTLTTFSQSISENAIGLRIGDSNGFGAEVSYQRAFGSNNRAEFDLGWRTGDGYSGFKLAALYQWVWQIEGNFNWYAGAGGGLGSYDYGNGNNNSGGTFIFAAGDIGIEYDFDIPLLLSLDFRPELGFGNGGNDIGLDIALGIRYQF